MQASGEQSQSLPTPTVMAKGKEDSSRKGLMAPSYRRRDKYLDNLLEHAKQQLPYTENISERSRLLGEKSTGEGVWDKYPHVESYIGKEQSPFAWLLTNGKRDQKIRPHFYTPSLAAYRAYGAAEPPARWSINSRETVKECFIDWDEHDGHVIVKGFGPLPATNQMPIPRQISKSKTCLVAEMDRRREYQEHCQFQEELISAKTEIAFKDFYLQKMEARKLRMRREFRKQMHGDRLRKSKIVDFAIPKCCSRNTDENYKIYNTIAMDEEAIASSSDESEEGVVIVAASKDAEALGDATLTEDKPLLTRL